jgi:three-Cys-motif partner protein
MTPPPIERYAGREQAYIKHFLLASYLEPFVHKIGSKYDQIVYVDGFSGPWENEGSDYADTSFGIALQALRTAKATWRNQNRNLNVKAVLVEKKERSFRKLLELQPRYPDVEIKPVHGDFRAEVDTILNEIPTNAFAFVLLDPKGWRIPIAAIEPLLRRPNTEVVFNFMFEFINRAASMTAADIVQGLDELLPAQGWREALTAVDKNYSERERPKRRREILIDTFRKVLAAHGGYEFVAETPVMRPLKNSMLYALVYATRSPTGIGVFRDCQIKTLREQETVRGAAKVAKEVQTSKQNNFFDTVQDLRPDPLMQILDDERRAAERYLVDLIPANGDCVRWKQLWPRVLERHTIRLTELKDIATRLAKDGSIELRNLLPPKRKPADDTIVRRLVGAERSQSQRSG